MLQKEKTKQKTKQTAMGNNKQISKRSTTKRLDHVDSSESDFYLRVHHQNDENIYDLEVNVPEEDFFVVVQCF